MNIIQDSFEQWCRKILTATFEVCAPDLLHCLGYAETCLKDPEIAKKIIQIMVTFSTKALTTRPAFALRMLEYLFNAPKQDNPAFPQYSQAVKDLERTCNTDIQRLAMSFPNEFMVWIFQGLQESADMLFRSISTNLKAKSTRFSPAKQ